jgi:hypothetical protein
VLMYRYLTHGCTGGADLSYHMGIANVQVVHLGAYVLKRHEKEIPASPSIVIYCLAMHRTVL